MYKCDKCGNDNCDMPKYPTKLTGITTACLCTYCLNAWATFILDNEEFQKMDRDETVLRTRMYSGHAAAALEMQAVVYEEKKRLHQIALEWLADKPDKEEE